MKALRNKINNTQRAADGSYQDTQATTQVIAWRPSNRLQVLPPQLYIHICRRFIATILHAVRIPPMNSVDAARMIPMKTQQEKLNAMVKDFVNYNEPYWDTTHYNI